jgi:RNA polymerase sigma-70 factor (ECF subfamily)
LNTIKNIFRRSGNTGESQEPSPASPPQTLTDEDLVTRAQHNHPGAIEELIQRYQSKAFAIAFHMSAGDREEAWDLTQEAFLKTFRNINTFRGKSSFYTWFYRIVVNTCIDGNRRRQRRERLFSHGHMNRRHHNSGPDFLETAGASREEQDPMALLSGKQLKREIWEALESLPQKQRLAFQLKLFHGMTIREISEIMGLASGTVKTHLFRATHAMRETLKDWLEP